MEKKGIKENHSYVLPSTDDELKLFIEKYKVDMMEQIITSIEYAISHKLSLIEVFQFKNSQFVITISEKEFESNLNNIHNFYMENEVYELCSRATKLQNLLKKKNDEKQKKASISNGTRPNHNQ
jgi:hypothetical protein